MHAHKTKEQANITKTSTKKISGYFTKIEGNVKKKKKKSKTFDMLTKTNNLLTRIDSELNWL